MKIVSTSLAALVATLLTSTASISANSTTSITNTIVPAIESSGHIVLAQAETEAEKKAKMMAKEAEMKAEEAKKAEMMATEEAAKKEAMMAKEAEMKAEEAKKAEMMAAEEAKKAEMMAAEEAAKKEAMMAKEAEMKAEEAKKAEMMAAEEAKKKAMMMAADACDSAEYSVVGFGNSGTDAGSVADIASKINALSTDGACLIEITGYSSTSGPKSINAALSTERAEWVKSQLMAAGVDVSQTNVTGAGETRQFGNSSANRRVVISVK
ncbi:MAG: OmpA family protein [Lentilitoribacter sp.]